MGKALAGQVVANLLPRFTPRVGVTVFIRPGPFTLSSKTHRCFVETAESLGISSILHTDYQSTCAKLASFGLRTDEGVVPRILAINGGSSSTKLLLFEGGNSRRILDGSMERIGLPGTSLHVKGENPADNLLRSVLSTRTKSS